MVLPLWADSDTPMFHSGWILEEEEILSGFGICGISSKIIFIPQQCPAPFLGYSNTVKQAISEHNSAVSSVSVKDSCHLWICFPFLEYEKDREEEAVRPQTWEEWQICFNRKPCSIFLYVSLVLNQITSQSHKCTNRPWLLWPASPGTSTHTHRGPLLQEPILSSSLQPTSLLFLNCLDFIFLPQTWLVTLLFCNAYWTVDETCSETIVDRSEHQWWSHKVLPYQRKLLYPVVLQRTWQWQKKEQPACFWITS